MDAKEIASLLINNLDFMAGRSSSDDEPAYTWWKQQINLLKARAPEQDTKDSAE